MIVFFGQIRKYLLYRWKAQNAHGLHSPFLYDIYNKVLHHFDARYDFGIRSLRSRLKDQKIHIEIADPKTKSMKTVRVDRYAKKSTSRHSFSSMMVRLINFLNAKTVLEAGTNTGINAAYLATSGAEKIITIEGSPELAEIAKQKFNRFSLSHVKLVVSDIYDCFENLLIDHRPELIFLDADHSAKALKFYMNLIHQHCPESCIIIHDIYWSDEMTDEWKSIIYDHRNNLTIDIFQAGIVFPKFPMEKQHFTLKF